MKTPEEIAGEHAGWYADQVRAHVYTAYKTAFLHGYKHGREAEAGA